MVPLQLKEKIWKGLQQHSLAGWNIGPVPYGYAADRIPHPAPIKAAQGLTSARLVPDPRRGPVVTRIFTWRDYDKLSIPAITARLEPTRPPTPPRTASRLDRARRRPDPEKPQVHRPHRLRPHPQAAPASEGNEVRLPPAQWIWAPDANPTPHHTEPSGSRPRRSGPNAATSATPSTDHQPAGHRYPLRARIRCNQCQRRMHGLTRPDHPAITNVYYLCPHTRRTPATPRPTPTTPPSSVTKTTIIDRPRPVLDAYLFGPDRAAMLAAQLPATAADHAERRRPARAAPPPETSPHRDRRRASSPSSKNSADTKDPAAQAYRARIRARYAELYHEHTAHEPS